MEILPKVEWPPEDVAAAGARISMYFRGAAICRRGHVESAHLEPGPRAGDRIASNCNECGAKVLLSCPGCGLRIRGRRFVPEVVRFNEFKRPSFCDGCGSAFPWATRAERIYELENLLDEEAIDEADRVVVQDHLERLRTEDLSPDDEKKAWTGIKQRTGGLLTSGPIARVVEGVATAAIRHQLGI